jgi:copper transport protein
VLRTGYGRALLTKLAVVGVVALLALWNKFQLVRVVARQPGPGPQWRRLRAAVLDEALLLVVILGVTGLLTLQNPAATPATPDGSTTGSAETASGPASDPGPPAGLQRTGLGSGSVAGRLSPAVAGPNTFDFTLRDGDGQPLVPPHTPVVTARLPDGRIGPIVATVTRLPGTGHYRADVVLPAAGVWRVQVAVRTDRFSEPTANLAFTVRR